MDRLNFYRCPSSPFEEPLHLLLDWKTDGVELFLGPLNTKYFSIYLIKLLLWRHYRKNSRIQRNMASASSIPYPRWIKTRTSCKGHSPETEYNSYELCETLICIQSFIWNLYFMIQYLSTSPMSLISIRQATITIK